MSATLPDSSSVPLETYVDLVAVTYIVVKLICSSTSIVKLYFSLTLAQIIHTILILSLVPYQDFYHASLNPFLSK